VALPSLKQIPKAQTGLEQVDRQFALIADILNPILRTLFQTQVNPNTPIGTAQTNVLYAGSGAPPNAQGNIGDFYFRTDTPATINQRLYIRNTAAWIGIV